MNVLKPILKPIADGWNYITHDQEWEKLTEFHGDWHTKYLRHEQNQKEREERAIIRKHKKLLYEDFLEDNILRFTAYAGIERFVTLRQAFSFLKDRFNYSKSGLGALTVMTRQGLFRGLLRGNLLNLAQQSTVQYGALSLSNGSAFSYIGSLLVLGALFHPLDTVRTLVQADTGRLGNIHGVLKGLYQSKSSLVELYRGVGAKTTNNLFFGLYAAARANDSEIGSIATLALWVLSYPLLVFKTKQQISSTPLSFNPSVDPKRIQIKVLRNEGIRGGYAGVIPFIALNVLLAEWVLPYIDSPAKKDKIIASFKEIRSDREKYF